MERVIKQYIDFQILKANAKAELDLLVAQNSKLYSRKDRDKATEIEIRIINQQTYLSRIDSILKQWCDALLMLSQTYNEKEYEMFVTLIVKDTPIEKIKKWSRSECLTFINRVGKQIKALTETDE